MIQTTTDETIEAMPILIPEGQTALIKVEVLCFTPLYNDFNYTSKKQGIFKNEGGVPLHGICRQGIQRSM